METKNAVFKTIWLADDDLDDCEVFRDVLEQILPTASLTIIPNGQELMNLLTPSTLPDMIFLDINMPFKDGLECLVEIRTQRQFSRLPIIIFSSSQQGKDIDKSYGYGANLYYSKPTTFAKLIEDMGELFNMNWNDPYTITGNHYINNKFVPFKVL